VKFTSRARTGVALAMTAAAAMTSLLAVPASATTNPPWEPDPNALGTLTLYNDTGQVVTGGSSLTHLIGYAEASTPDANTGAKATLQFAQPTFGVDPGDWPVGQASLSTVTPPASAPAPLNTATNPVASVSSNYGNLQTFINTQTAQTQAGYVNVYQIRLVTGGGGGGSSQNAQYWDADVVVNPTSGSWLEEYPDQGSVSVTTQTTLVASPASAATQNSSVTLTATVAATDATHPDGSVEFFQDGSSIGAGTFTPATGIATLTTTSLLPSSLNGTELTAVFTPTNTSSYGPSTSNTVTYTVNPVAKKPTISGSHRVGAAEKCSDGTLDFGVTATYSWLVSGKKVGSGSSFTVPAAEYKKSLTCSVTVHDGSGPASAAMTSSAVKISLGSALKDKKKPTISRSAKVGKKEKVAHGTWSPSATKYSYQWYLGKAKIKGATKSSYKLVKKDAKKKISCKVTASKTGYASGSATTKSVTVKK
jgi:hypothetical protein